jgi:alcohol dehydrogenase class IV
MNFEFNLRTKTFIGKGCINKVVDFLIENKYSRVGLIIDVAIIKNTYIIQFLETLEERKLNIIRWNYDLPFEPDYKSLDEKKVIFKNNEERNTIANAGILRSKADHSYDARSRYLIDLLSSIGIK